MRVWLVLLIALGLVGCSLYDYYPRGIHVYLQTIPGVNKNARVHVVKKGETLALIGRTYGVDYRDIARRNGIKKPYTIYVGQRLIIRDKPVTQQGSGKGKGTHALTATATGGKTLKLIWPVQGTLTSRFGLRKGRMHDGIDIAAKVGTPIYAAAAGKVVYADNKLTGYGNLIIIRHNHNMFTAYAHNQSNFVSSGDTVRQGQHIANVGQTGRATGPHVHFELRRGETAINPIPYLPKR